MFDVIVVGGGAAGLSAAQVLGRQQRRVLVVDRGQPRNAPAEAMHMYLSRDGFSPRDLLALGRDELSRYPSVETRASTVVEADGEIDEFTVRCSDASQERGRRLILATGQVDEPYEIPGLGERFGHSVFHCPFCHGWESRGKTLAVVGRDGPRVMLAAYLADRFSDDVLVATHGPHELPEDITSTLAARGIDVWDQPLTKVTGERDDLRLHFADGSTVDRQAIFHRAPTRQTSPIARDLGCAMLDDGCVQVDEYQSTSVPGVSAAGDMARLAALPDPMTLVSQAAADGVRAAVWLEQGLFQSTLSKK